MPTRPSFSTGPNTATYVGLTLEEVAHLGQPLLVLVLIFSWPLPWHEMIGASENLKGRLETSST